MRHTIIALALFALPAAAEPRQAGNILYDLPAGWEAVETETDTDGFPATELRHEDWLDNGLPFVTLTRGTNDPPDGDALLGWASSHLQAHLELDDDERLTMENWKELGDFGPGPVWFGVGAVANPDTGTVSDVVGAFLLDLGERAELVFTEVRVRRVEDPAAALKAAVAFLTGSLEGFRFVSKGAQPLLGAPRPGPFAGVYHGTHLRIMPGFDGSVQTDLVHELVVMQADGRFYEGIPPGGVAGLNDPDLRLMRTGDWGHYEVSGDRVTLRYANGEVDDMDYEDGTLTFGNATLSPIGLLPDGTTFAATRESIFFVATGIGFDNRTSVSGSSTIVFRTDGTFGREGFTGATGTYDTGAFATSNETSADGRYEVRGGEIVLRFQDGRVWRWDCFVLQDKGEAPTLWLGGKIAELAPGYRLPAQVRGDAAVAAAGAPNPLAAPAVNPLATAQEPTGPRNPLASPTDTIPANPLAKSQQPRNPLSSP
ncbi:MAG: hypothetical protein AAF919_02705 [Pseudomonadota bacterium]